MNKETINRDGLVNNDSWATPEYIYNKLNDEFNFDFDPCPIDHNIDLWDGLKVDWGKRNFVNPPYNRIDKPKFITKAFEEYKKDKLVVMLLPVATSTKQFHEIIYPNAEIRFVKGRIKFKGINTNGKYVTSKTGKHDSMICIFNPHASKKNNSV
jgi:site-specific DNA-methyltransferase (adenine-specific)